MTPPKEIEPIKIFSKELIEVGERKAYEGNLNLFAGVTIEKKLNELIDAYNQLIKQNEKRD